MGGMPACAIHDDHGMATRCNMAGYLKEVLVHGIGIGEGQNQCGTRAFGWADGAKNIRTRIALICYSARP